MGHLLFASSNTVYGQVPPGRPAAEDAPPRPESHYARSKVAGEELLRTRAEGEPGLACTVLRLAYVYHPGGPSLERVATLCRAVGARDNLLHAVHLEDAAAAFVHFLDKPPAEGFQVLNIADDRPITAKAFLGLVRGAKVPPFAAKMLPPELVRLGRASLAVDTSRARALGFAPRHPSLADALRSNQ